VYSLVRNWKKFLNEGIVFKIPFSYEPHTELNKKFWNQPGEKLDPEIRLKLLEIAQDFIDSSQASGAPLKDITFTGSLANFNYTILSDVDLHVLYDFSDINEDVELVRQYFQAAKSVWNYTHNIIINDHEVEIYGQEASDPHTASGLYSVLNDEWIVKPDRADPKIDYKDIRVKADAIGDEIERIEALLGEEKFEEIIDRSSKLKEKIRRMRSAGLSDVGEYSVENLAFKTLRNNDYLGRLSDVKISAYDKMMSMED